MNAGSGVARIADWAKARALDFRHDGGSGHGAVFSRCGRYRYLLWRDAHATRPIVAIAMLNPSKADHDANDPTIARCHARVRGMAGSLLVWNLFALMETSPAQLRKRRAPSGPYNDEAMMLALDLADTTIVAWGVHGAHRGAGERTLAACRAAGGDVRCFGWTRHGHPRHPLYLRKDVVAQRL